MVLAGFLVIDVLRLASIIWLRLCVILYLTLMKFPINRLATLSLSGHLEKLLSATMYTMLSTTKYQHIPYLVALVDCTLGNIARENTTADILAKDHLWPTLDMATVDQDRNCTDQIAELSMIH